MRVTASLLVIACLADPAGADQPARARVGIARPELSAVIQSEIAAGTITDLLLDVGKSGVWHLSVAPDDVLNKVINRYRKELVLPRKDDPAAKEVDLARAIADQLLLPSMSKVSREWVLTATLVDLRTGDTRVFKARRGAGDARSLEGLVSDLWHALDLPPVRATLTHADTVWRVRFSPDSKLAATTSFDTTAKVWDVQTGKLLCTLKHDRSVWDCAFDPSNKHLATASADNTAKIWEAQSGKLLLTLKHDGWVNTVEFSPDGKSLATASVDKTARIWDSTTGRIQIALPHEFVNVKIAAFGAEGKVLGTASLETVARLWDTQTGAVKATLQHGDKVDWLVFNPDGSRVATASDSNAVKLWDGQSGELQGTCRHEGYIGRMVFSADGALLATGSADKTARVWATKTARQVSSFLNEFEVGSVALSPDKRLLAIAGTTSAKGETKSAKVCDLQTGKVLVYLPHDDRVWWVEFSPDGNLLATGSKDHTAKLWEITPGR